MGDEGSGYAIALAGLRRACACADGRGVETRLVERLLTEFDCEKPPELIERIYAPDMTRKRIAQACRVVFECAEGGDALATEITASANRDLFQLVENVAGRLAFEGGNYTLALGGGVLCHQSRFAAQVIERLDSAGIAPGRWRSVDCPARGALLLADQLLALR